LGCSDDDDELFDPEDEDEPVELVELVDDDPESDDELVDPLDEEPDELEVDWLSELELELESDDSLDELELFLFRDFFPDFVLYFFLSFFNSTSSCFFISASGGFEFFKEGLRLLFFSQAVREGRAV